VGGVVVRYVDELEYLMGQARAPTLLRATDRPEVDLTRLEIAKFFLDFGGSAAEFCEVFHSSMHSSTDMSSPSFCSAFFSLISCFFTLTISLMRFLR
jgi:hypothetical protein